MAESTTETAALEVEAHELRTGIQSAPPENEQETNPETERKTASEPFPTLRASRTNATTASSNRPYSSFSKRQRWFIVGLSALAGVFSPIGSNIYVPAIPTLADAFHVSNEKINLTVTVYLVFQAFTPAIWGNASDTYGRRPVYCIILLIFLFSTIVTALCPTDAYWLLMLMRAVQSTGGSATIAIGAGVIGDIARPEERGKFFGIFNLGTLFGPAVSPVLGGVFAYTLGWRSIFYFLLILSAIAWILITLFLPETLRSIVGDGSIPPPLINCTPSEVLRRRKGVSPEVAEEAQELQAQPRKRFRPWASLALALHPDLTLMLVWMSLFYAEWYAVLTIFSTFLENTYHKSEIIIGLCYIPHGVGAGVSSFITGRLIDRVYNKEKARVGGDHRQKPTEFRLERSRLIVLPSQLVVMVGCCISIGWSVQAHAPLAVPVILMGLLGLSLGFFTSATVYGLDLFPTQGGATTATFNLIRCVFGAVAVSVVQIINSAVGAGWTFVILSAVTVAGTPIPFILLKYGPKWRLGRIQKAKLKAEAARRASTAA